MFIPHPDSDKQKKLDNRLLAALGAKQFTRVRDELAAGADPDTNNSTPLINCTADAGDYRMAKLLIIEGGADVHAAISVVRAQIQALSKITFADTSRKQDTLQRTLDQLNDYKKAIVDMMLPLEIKSNLKQILDNQKRFDAILAEFDAALRSVTEPHQLDKRIHPPVKKLSGDKP
jgi:hypothetical protein